MAKRRRLQDLTPSEISRITQKAALVEAEYIHRHRPLNDDDTVTLRMLSIMTVAESLLILETKD
jgi:hypothetical protein